MPLKSNLYIGLSGLASSQHAINTTAHNLANINTEGFVRQQAQFGDRSYYTYAHSAVNTMQVGSGVYSASAQHYRDILLDIAYREESGRQEYYAAQYDAIEEMESVLGELNGEAFQENLLNLWSSINEMAKMPDSTVARASLVMHAEEFISRSNKIYNSFSDYQSRMDEKIELTVNRINEIGAAIVKLNDKIQGVEAVGVEQAMDYRDQRDLLLDELSGLINIQYKEDENGYLTVRAEGQEFVTKGGYFPMSLKKFEGASGESYAIPVWPQMADSKVFDLSITISTAEENDMGQLKGLVLARGSYEATYRDIPHEPPKPLQEDFMDENGNLDMDAYKAAIDKYWSEDYAAYEKDIHRYNTTVGNSAIMKAQAIFDQLVNGIVTTINDCFSPTKESTIAAGSTLTLEEGTVYNQLSDEMKAALEEAGITKDAFNDRGVLDEKLEFTLKNDLKVRVLDMDKTSYGTDEDKTPGTELFSRADVTERYTAAANEAGEKIYIYNTYNQYGLESYYSCDNLVINQTILDEYSYLPLSTKEGKVDMDICQNIIDKWEETYINLDPSNLTPKNFMDYYNAMVGLIANDGSVCKTIAENESLVVGSIDDARESFFGVSSNDELTNMIKFQNAYNANARYVNVISEMLDSLINNLGR